MITIPKSALPACPVQRTKHVINQAEQRGIKLPLIITHHADSIVVRGAK